MHNNIMAAGSRDRPPLIATGRYAQWQSRFLRYIDTRLNGDALRKCILKGPYKPSTVIILTVPATDDSPEVLEQTAVETILNMSPENKEHYQSENEAIHLLLTRIGDEIYSIVDACKTAHDMWIAIERLQQGDDRDAILEGVDFGDIPQLDGIEVPPYVCNMDIVALIDVNAAQSKLVLLENFDENYSKCLRLLVKLQLSNASTKFKGKEIAKLVTHPSELASEEDSDHEQAQRDKDMQKNLALNAKYFKKIYKPTNNNLRTSSNSRNKNMDTTPRYNNDNQTGPFRNQRTVTIAGARETVGSQVVQQTGIQCFNCKEFDHFTKECRKPKRVKDYTYHKENMLLCKQAEKCVPLQAEQADWLEDMNEEIDEQELEAHYNFMVHNDAKYNVFTNVRQHSKQPESTSNTCLVENDDSNVTPDSPDMCDNDIQTIQKQLKKANSSLAHELKECKSIIAKTSRTLGESNSIRDSCLIALQNKQTEFKRYKALNDRTVDYDKLERKLNETLGLLVQKDINIKEGLVKEKTKHSRNHFRAPTALDMEVLIKTYLMPLAIKTQNDSFTFVHELKQEMHADLKYVESIENEIDELESDKTEFSNMYDILLQECVSNDKVKKCECLAQKLSKQTESISKEVYTELLQSFAKLEKHLISLELDLQQCQEQMKIDTVCKEKASNVFKKEREQYFEIQDLKAQLQDKNIAISELKKLIEKCKGKSVETKFDKPSVILPQTARQAVRNINVIKPGMYRINTRTTKTRAPQLPQTSRNTNPRVSTSTRVSHRTNVSRPQLRSTQMKDKVMPNNSQVKDKKTKVEDHPRISSISNKIKFVTASNDNLKSRTLNVNAVCATCGKCVFNSNHDACVSKYLNDVNARNKKPKVGPISTRKPKSQVNKSVTTSPKKTVASESTIQKSKSYYRMLYKKTSKREGSGRAKAWCQAMARD
ncbi:retrovirus-related pol polyprotein from transposon TNT 1-94 [Tanacetum coccineum]